MTGSLGDPREETHAPTFFAGTAVQYLDYSDAERAFGASGSALRAAVPVHPSYEDREGAPDLVFSAVPAELSRHVSSAWETSAMSTPFAVKPNPRAIHPRCSSPQPSGSQARAPR